VSSWWKNRSFVYLTVSRVLGYTADELLILSLTVYVFRTSGTGAALGTYFLARLLPSVLLGPFAGILVDRSDQRLLTAWALALTGGVALFLHRAHTVRVIAAFAASNAALGTIREPAFRAMLPRTVGEDFLLQANSIHAAAQSAARFLAPAISAVTCMWLGVTGSVLAASLLYVLSACTIWAMGALSPVQIPADQHAGARSVIAGLGEGFKCLVGHPLLLTVTLLVTAVMVADSAVSPLFTLMLKELSAPPEFIGYLSSGYGVGVLAGAPMAAAIRCLASERALLLGGAFTVGVQMIAYSRIRVFAIALPLQVLSGIGFTLLFTAATTLFQKTAPSQFLGRVISLSTAAGSAATAVAVRVGGTIGDLHGVRTVFLWAGILCLGAGVACGRQLVASSRKTCP